MNLLLVTSYHKGRLGWFCHRAFEKLGVETSIFNYDQKFLFSYRYGVINKRLVDVVRREKPDVLFVTKGKCIFPETVEKIKSKFGVLTCNWWPDDPLDFKASLKKAACYDFYFTNDKDTIGDYKEAGIRNVNFLPFGCDEEVHKSLELKDEEKELYRSDVCFIGQWSLHREKMLEKLAGNLNLKVWGQTWEKKIGKDSKLRECLMGRSVYADEMVKAYAGAKICLNIWKRDHGVNMRLFEIAGCGGFQIADLKGVTDDVFTKEKEVVFLNDYKGIEEKVKFYLNKDTERAGIARQSQARAYLEHTYVNRMSQFLNIIGGNM